MTVGQVKNYRRQWEADALKGLTKGRNKVYRRLVKARWEPTLYFVEARLMAWLCGQPWAQRRYWGKKVALVQEFLRATNLAMYDPALQPAQVIRQALFCDSFFFDWRSRLSAWPPAQLMPLITVRGEDVWQSAYQQGKGVILLQYHTLAGRLVFPWLAYMGVQPRLSIDPARKIAKAAGQSYSAEMAPFLRARQLHAAKSCLEAGGVVRIVPDFQQGNECIPVPLYQRTRRFPPAFAELALRTGAVMLPASASVDLHGRVAITFHAPLHTGDASQSRSERIAAIVKQYVAFLHTAWLTAPGNLKLEQMASFVANGAPMTKEGSMNNVV
jgi:lauroyl/myristoyl acyltransferase